MKGLQALQADRKELKKKFLKLVAEQDAVAEEVQKIDNAIAALGGEAVGGAAAKPVAKRKKGKLSKVGLLKLRLGQAKRRGQADKIKALTAEIEKLEKKA